MKTYRCLIKISGTTTHVEIKAQTAALAKAIAAKQYGDKNILNVIRS